MQHTPQPHWGRGGGVEQLLGRAWFGDLITEWCGCVHACSLCGAQCCKSAFVWGGSCWRSPCASKPRAGVLVQLACACRQAATPQRPASAGRVVLLPAACCAVSCGLPLRLLCPSQLSRPLVCHTLLPRLLLLGTLPDLFLLSHLTCDERPLILPPPPQFGIHPTPQATAVCVLAACVPPVCGVQYVCSWVAHNDIETRRNACCFLLVQVLILVLLEGSRQVLCAACAVECCLRVSTASGTGSCIGICCSHALASLEELRHVFLLV